MKLFRQRDYPDKLGFGSTTIAGYGCKLCSLAMLSGIEPPKLNKQFKKDGAFSGDLLIDEKCAKSLGWTFRERTTKKPKEVCIAEVDMSPAPGKQQHFVVFLADGTIADPWTGTIRPENTYPFVTFRLFDTKKALYKPKEAKESIIMLQEPPKSESDVQVPPKPIQSVESGSDNQPSNNNMNLQGYRTYIGLAITLAGVLGATQYISTEEMEKTAKLTVELIGIAIAIYGRYKATK